MHLLPFFFLALAFVFLWTPLRKGWFVPFVVSVMLAVTQGKLTVVGIGGLALLLLACFFSYNQKKLLLPKFLADGVILVLGAYLMMKITPGFKDYRVIAPVQISPNCPAFSFYLKFGKGALGLILLSFMPGVLSQKKKDWMPALSSGAVCTLIAIVLLLVSSLALGYVTWDFKLPSFWRVWVFYNLFFVSIPEEAFFRGFLLTKIAQLCRKWQSGNMIALVISSLLFGVAHIYGGISFAILSTLAGLLYGLAFLWSEKLEGAIFTHFWVNTIHFLAFSYPCLSS
jgi:uncharacterized protein